MQICITRRLMCRPMCDFAPPPKKKKMYTYNGTSGDTIYQRVTQFFIGLWKYQVINSADDNLKHWWVTLVPSYMYRNLFYWRGCISIIFKVCLTALSRACWPPPPRRTRGPPPSPSTSSSSTSGPSAWKFVFRLSEHIIILKLREGVKKPYSKGHVRNILKTIRCFIIFRHA